MTDQEVYLKACERYRKMNGGRLVFMADLVTFLEKEIDSLRTKNDELKTAIDRKEKEIKINDDFAESVAEAVQEMANRWTETSKRIEKLGQTIENGVDVSYIEDGGKMSIDRASIGSVANSLLSSGYFVCCHFDDGDTATIEFWRA